MEFSNRGGHLESCGPSWYSPEQGNDEDAAGAVEREEAGQRRSHGIQKRWRSVGGRGRRPDQIVMHKEKELYRLTKPPRCHVGAV